jgi:hypothetical protein
MKPTRTNIKRQKKAKEDGKKERAGLIIQLISFGGTLLASLTTKPG